MSQLASGSRNSQLASGSGRNRPKDIFRTHAAPKLIELVHRCEECMHIHRDDRVLRLAMTMADGAIQAQGRHGLKRKRQKLTSDLYDMLASVNSIAWTTQGARLTNTSQRLSYSTTS